MQQAASEQFTPRLIDALYIEALVLADEARTYFDEDCKTERAMLAPEARVLFSCEAIKVTTRLMHVITWLLSARVMAAGEVSRLAVVPPTDHRGIACLPAAAESLITASEELYRRVVRLQMRSTTPSFSNPAHQLMAQLGNAF